MMFPAKTVLDIGAAAWLSIFSLQATASPMLGSETQNIAAACTVAITIMALVYGIGRIVERFQLRGLSNQSKLANDDKRIEHIEQIVLGIEKDLIGRRALVDKEISHLQWQMTSFESRLSMTESRHNKLRDKFNVVIGSLAPVLKDMDADFTRGGTMAKVFAAIDENDTEITDDGRT